VVTVIPSAWLDHIGAAQQAPSTSPKPTRSLINVFRRADRYLFFLTYGSDAQWVRNVLAAGECWIRMRGRDVRLVEPEVVVDPTDGGVADPAHRPSGRRNRVPAAAGRLSDPHGGGSRTCAADH